MNIYLIGLPGCGKTTIGKQLAALLNLQLIDTDTEIIKGEGSSIETIFKVKGESFFRRIEQETLHAVSQGNNLLISTGGGMPCFYDNIDYMNQHGITIFIDVPTEIIQQRLILQRTQNRPMLEDKTDEQVLLFLNQKHKERLPYYSKALLRIQGENITAEDVLDVLKSNELV